MDIKSLFIVLIILFAGACVRQPITGVGAGEGAAYTPVVDGPQDEIYYKDLRECRQLAAQVQQRQQAGLAEDAATGAVTGGVLGALVGATEDSDKALVGGLIGAAVGGAVGAGDTAMRAERSGKTIITRCMQGRGHNVLL